MRSTRCRRCQSFGRTKTIAPWSTTSTSTAPWFTTTTTQKSQVHLGCTVVRTVVQRQVLDRRSPPLTVGHFQVLREVISSLAAAAVAAPGYQLLLSSGRRGTCLEQRGTCLEGQRRGPGAGARDPEQEPGTSSSLRARAVIVCLVIVSKVEVQSLRACLTTTKQS